MLALRDFNHVKNSSMAHHQIQDQILSLYSHSMRGNSIYCVSPVLTIVYIIYLEEGTSEICYSDSLLLGQNLVFSTN